MQREFMIGLKNLIALEINEAGPEHYVFSIYKPNYAKMEEGRSVILLVYINLVTVVEILSLQGTVGMRVERIQNENIQSVPNYQFSISLHSLKSTEIT